MYFFLFIFMIKTFILNVSYSDLSVRNTSNLNQIRKKFKLFCNHHHHRLFSSFSFVKSRKISLVKEKQFLKETCKCKFKTLENIVKGEEVIKNSIPWQVSLAENNYHFCGGFIASSQWIITAAHCVFESVPSNLYVRVGIHKLNDPDILKKTYSVLKIIIHPNYKESDLSKNDIALIKLKRKLNFNKFSQIQPACLGLKERNYNRQILISSGWGSIVPTSSGKIQNNGILSNVLKKAKFSTLKRNQCESNFLICIKAVHKGDSICDGDSGGPLHFTSKKGKTTVEGICSFGYGISLQNKTIKYCIGTGAYTRLSSYKSFITTHITDLCGCN